MNYTDYQNRFAELKAMKDYEASHSMADELLKLATFDLYYNNITLLETIELHKLFDELIKYYA